MIPATNSIGPHKTTGLFAVGFRKVSIFKITQPMIERDFDANSFSLSFPSLWWERWSVIQASRALGRYFVFVNCREDINPIRIYANKQRSKTNDTRPQIYFYQLKNTGLCTAASRVQCRASLNGFVLCVRLEWYWGCRQGKRSHPST